MAAAEVTEPCVCERFAALAPDEQDIMELLLERIEAGQKTYGSWNISDGRHYPGEALEEVIDALHYSAAALLRHSDEQIGRPPRIYVCHPYSNNPEENCACVRQHCRRLALQGLVPIAPQLYLPNFIDEVTERALALLLCKELVRCCDEVWIFGAVITPGMQKEIQFAREHGITVRFAEDAS